MPSGVLTMHMELGKVYLVTTFCCLAPKRSILGMSTTRLKDVVAAGAGAVAAGAVLVSDWADLAGVGVILTAASILLTALLSWVASL